MSWTLVDLMIGEDGEAAFKPSPASLFVLPASREGEEAAGQLAATTGAEFAGRISSCSLDGEELLVRRSAFGGRVELETRYSTGPVIATSNQPLGDRPAVCVAAPPGLDFELVSNTGGETALEGAQLVVSGGRGLDEEDFRSLRAIAEKLGGALGGSLPAVDLGLVPVSRQIGQSGKFVTPAIYLAVGLSGTPQHLAGIGAATRIIAINKDSAAPIFKFAEAGAIADAKLLLPRLLAALSEGPEYV